MKAFSITFLILIFLSFLFFQTKKNDYLPVLEVVSPVQIAVDLNKNGVQDSDEILVLKNVQSFSSKVNQEQTRLAHKLNISEEDSIGLGFLAQNFAKETLEGKNVQVKDSEIIVDNKNYGDLLLDKGFAFEKGEAPSKEFYKNLNKVKKLHLVIFNNKSHKYHKLNCKYGIIAHNSQIIPILQLPKDAKPCKFCFSPRKIQKDNKFQKRSTEIIPYVKAPSTVFQSGLIKIILTDFTKVLKPNNSCNIQVCKALVDKINSANETIDFAIYGYTKVPAVQSALESAQKRGVKIRFVYDLDDKHTNIYPDTLYLSKIFTFNRSDLSGAIMHDKFFIFDNKTVYTGSANISNTDMSGFNSNAVVIIDSEAVANIYEKEFEQMYSGSFHKSKKRIKDKNLSLSGANLDIYFSPKDKGVSAIVPLINSSTKYVYIPAFLITHKELTDSLIRASKRGVSVKIILDATNTHTPHSKMKMLRGSGIEVKTENFAGKLHSKSIIIDDLYTAIGSMNFSKSGEMMNDENLIIIKNSQIAVFYKTFFQHLWQRIPEKWLKYNARSESVDSIGSCSDGIDNDFDGKIDKADDSCTIIKKHK